MSNSESTSRDSKNQETELKISQQKEQVELLERDLDHMYLKKTFLPLKKNKKTCDTPPIGEQLNRDGVFPQGGGLGAAGLLYQLMQRSQDQKKKKDHFLNVFNNVFFDLKKKWGYE